MSVTTTTITQPSTETVVILKNPTKHDDGDWFPLTKLLISLGLNSSYTSSILRKKKDYKNNVSKLKDTLYCSSTYAFKLINKLCKNSKTTYLFNLEQTDTESLQVDTENLQIDTENLQTDTHDQQPSFNPSTELFMSDDNFELGGFFDSFTNTHETENEFHNHLVDKNNSQGNNFENDKLSPVITEQANEDFNEERLDLDDDEDDPILAELSRQCDTTKSSSDTIFLDLEDICSLPEPTQCIESNSIHETQDMNDEDDDSTTNTTNTPPVSVDTNPIPTTTNTPPVSVVINEDNNNGAIQGSSTNTSTGINTPPSQLFRIPNKLSQEIQDGRYIIMTETLIDLSQLQFVCAHCYGSQIVKYKKSGNNKRTYITPEQTKIRLSNKQRGRTIHNISITFTKFFKDFIEKQGHDFASFYALQLQDPKLRTIIIDALVLFLNADKKNSAYFNKLFSKFLCLDYKKLAYITDKLLISGNTYFRLLKESNLTRQLPSYASMMNYKKTLSQRVKNEFELTTEKINNITLSTVSVEKMISKIFLIYKAELKLKNMTFKEKKYRFKVACDGRDINGQKQTALAIVPLDMEEVFPLQEVLSVFYIGIVESDEKKEVMQALASKFKCFKKGFKIDNCNIKFYYCSDLKNVGLIVEKSCLYCDYNLGSSIYKIRKSGINGYSLLRIRYSNHIPCILHLKQRIHERLLAYIASSLHEKDFATFTRNIQQLPKCKDFHWKSKKEVPSEDQLDVDDERVLPKTNQIRGYQVDIMLRNIDDIFTGLDSVNNKPNFVKILTIWRELLCFIQATTKEIEKFTEDKFLDMLNARIRVFYLSLKGTFTERNIKAKYIHMLQHLPGLFKTYGSLCKYSNQGFENSHKYHKSVATRLSNNGGSKNPVPLIEFLLVWQGRRMLSCLETESNWSEVVIRHRTPKAPTLATNETTNKTRSVSFIDFDSFKLVHDNIPKDGDFDE